MVAVVVPPPAAGRRAGIDRAAAQWKLTAAASDGALALFEQELAPVFETPMRRHAERDEALYVLAVEILLVGERRLQRVQAGGFVWIPRGRRHGFVDASEGSPARLLGFHAPVAAAARRPGSTRAFVVA